jgi:predicted secreted protein
MLTPAAAGGERNARTPGTAAAARFMSRVAMSGRLGLALAALLLCRAALADDNAPTPQPVLTVTASAQASIANDRMHAMMRAEAENGDPRQAASEVNARMARALARVKATHGIDAATSGYSSFQVGDKDHLRWRVAQTLTLQGSDFAVLSALVSNLQADDGLLLSGLGFSVSPAALSSAEDALMKQAIHAWQQRAAIAAHAFGSGNWRAGRVNVQTSDLGRPQPMLRGQTFAAAKAAPVNVEAGDSDISVTVSGEVILDAAVR